MNIRSDLREGRVGVRMGCVFAGEQRNQTVCSMNIFFYCVDPREWGIVSLNLLLRWGLGRYTYAVLLLTPPVALLPFTSKINKAVPP